MTAGTGERLASDYLARLDAAARTLPADRRTELLEGITEHLDSARAAGELGDEAAARTLLDRLGEPEEIVAAAREEGPAGRGAAGGTPPGWGPPSWQGSGPGHAPPPAPGRPTVMTPPSTALETTAVLMLTAGSLLPVVGWLVGVALLWTSRRWRTGEKLLGTLVVPFGPGILLPLGALTGFSTQTCYVSATVGGGVGGFSGEVPLELTVPGEPPAPPLPPESGPPELAPPPAGGNTQTVETCTQPWLSGTLALVLAVLALGASIAVAVLLLRRARTRAAAEPPVARPVRAGGGSPWGALEIAAVVLLGIGPFVAPVVGPAVALVLAWCSPRWSTPEKAVATALALTPALLLGIAFTGVLAGLSGLALGAVGLFALSVLGSVAAAIYLAVVLSRRP